MSAFASLQLQADDLFRSECYEKAAEIYEKCALEGNNINSQRTLAYMLENGMGVKLDVQKAAAFYSLAAGQDDPASTINLASFYFAGKGVRQDKIRGANLLRRLLGQLIRQCTQSWHDVTLQQKASHSTRRKHITVFTSGEAGEPRQKER